MNFHRFFVLCKQDYSDGNFWTLRKPWSALKMVSNEDGIFWCRNHKKSEHGILWITSGSWKNAMFQEDVNNDLISLDPGTFTWKIVKKPMLKKPMVLSTAWICLFGDSLRILLYGESPSNIFWELFPTTKQANLKMHGNSLRLLFSQRHILFRLVRIFAGHDKTLLAWGNCGAWGRKIRWAFKKRHSTTSRPRLVPYGCFLKWWYPQTIVLIGFSIINHPFWGTPIFGNTHK